MSGYEPLKESSYEDSSHGEVHTQTGDNLEGAPPFAAGSALAPGYEVIEHMHRSNGYDVYDIYSEERACSAVAKTPRPDRLAERGIRRALLREGELLSNLKHPHIVRAYEVLQTPRPTVIVETLTGETLAYLIDESSKRLALKEICFLGLHLCSALHYLHGQGLLHLDLKPSNIISERGMAKILDLSLARPPGVSKAGVGTRHYLSVEQAAGGYLGPAADVWGLGAVLFEAASGELPFEAYDEEGRYEQLERPAEPLGRYRRVPAAFEDLVRGCLSSRPGERPSISGAAEALEDLT